MNHSRQRIGGGWTWGWVLVFTLAGCAGNDVEDLQRFVDETKSKFKGQVAAMPDVAVYQRYDYHTAKMRDPFRFAPLAVAIAPPTKGGGPGPDMKRQREDLEKYPLDALQMAGILRKDGEVWALIKAPDGSIHRVKRGNFIGQNFGKIEAISEAKVDIVEMVNGTRGWVRHQNALIFNRMSQQ